MRKGYWIILDELNLAPTDVLEALNRLLDDNRELFVAETQEVIKAHPRFLLFSTQNPPGLYGGRKVSPSVQSERDLSGGSEVTCPISFAQTRRFISRELRSRLGKIARKFDVDEL